MHDTMPRSVIVALLAVVVLPRPSAAQSGAELLLGPNEPAAESKRGKVLHALRLTGSAPRIDGVLDEEAWTHAEIVEGMVQTDPDNMQPMTERTRMQVAYDDRFLYVAVRCDDATPDRIVAGLGRRDEPPTSDQIGIGFDPRHDHQTGYVFQTNPSGVQLDLSFYNDDSSDRDYNSVWEVRTSIGAEGWIAEYRIPFSQLRFTPSPGGQVWGFGVRRTIQRRSEVGDWTPYPRGERGVVSRWGHLVFDEPIRPPRRIEWLPYVLASTNHLPEKSAAFNAGVGLDMRLGIGSGATLSATMNPDFGQVEQDPAVLNLTVFETFFPEKRPFFLEDSQTFVPPYFLFQLFHSRRIGKRPSYSKLAADDTEVDRPDHTTILGAMKLTGKRSRWTYGALTAATAPEYAIVDTKIGAAPGVNNSLRQERLVEPRTSYNVVRLQRDLRGTSNVGLIATGVMRADALDAYAGGGDYSIRWDRNRTEVSGHWVGTRAPVDGRLRSGIGGVSNFNFSRKHFGFFAHADHFDKDFRVDDLGFFRSRADRTDVDGGMVLEQPDPWKIFRRVGVNVQGGRAWNRDGVDFAKFAGVFSFAQLRNFWNIEGGVVRDFEALDDLDTRGGPPIVQPARLNGFLFFASDSRKSWRFVMGHNFTSDAVGGWDLRFGPSLNLKPTGQLQASISASYNFGRSIAQWIKNEDVTADGIADHVYGTLDRDIVDVTVRSTYAINRDLTVQVFLQPFVAVGDYTSVRRLARPSSFDFDPVVLLENPDFNNKSLKGNVVLRWEYIRGSTLFVAWNMSTSDKSRPGVFNARRDLGDAFGGAGTHAFLVKMTYWLSQ
jgi:uncharacterized protein DUF5916/cellulose/xylan binding protein with CBM9 domain